MHPVASWSQLFDPTRLNPALSLCLLPCRHDLGQRFRLSDDVTIPEVGNRMSDDRSELSRAGGLRLITRRSLAMPLCRSHDAALRPDAGIESGCSSLSNEPSAAFLSCFAPLVGRQRLSAGPARRFAPAHLTQRRRDRRVYGTTSGRGVSLSAFRIQGISDSRRSKMRRFAAEARRRRRSAVRGRAQAARRAQREGT